MFETLKQNYEFRRLYSRGKSAAAPLMVIYYRKNGRNHNRLGITVSTKVGKAVVRNRIRRRFREIFRAAEPCLVRGVDIVMVARYRSRFAKYSELESEFLKLANKLSLLEKNEEQP